MIYNLDWTEASRQYKTSTEDFVSQLIQEKRKITHAHRKSQDTNRFQSTPLSASHPKLKIATQLRTTANTPLPPTLISDLGFHFCLFFLKKHWKNWSLYIFISS